ncbi:hypothetical protein BDA96_02G337200 [Sorghum bicolor]|uniref:Uncharacterized protein n=1 Tax=Sorghum bicolor TaxID=4558 RepID=A0A921RRH4_SORBI|nr:hypothetical protein BDA96_02G337200 [Sorghum bicolor]
MLDATLKFQLISSGVRCGLHGSYVLTGGDHSHYVPHSLKNDESSRYATHFVPLVFCNRLKKVCHLLPASVCPVSCAQAQGIVLLGPCLVHPEI